MSVLEAATEAANRIIHGDEHSEDEVQLVSGELLRAAALLREYEEALSVWQAWLREHLDALPADEDEFDDDDRAVLSSMRYVVELDPGCTEADDYEGTGKWEAMQTLRAALSKDTDG
jgi:hypothetical protein